jgi:tetratricopeptide (TPR) repeat protein
MKEFEFVPRLINKVVFLLLIINIPLFAGDENQALVKTAQCLSVDGLDISDAEDYQHVRGALQNFERASARDSFPAKAEVCMEMGNIYFENNEFDRAFTSFERAYKSSLTATDSARALVGEIKALILDGQEKKAEKSIAVFKSRFDANRPLAAEIAFSKGLRGLVEKDYNKALALFNEFLARYPQSRFQPAVYFKIGMIYHDRGDFVQAAQLFERAQGFASADVKTRFRAAYNAALDYQKSSSWLQAARMYEAIVDSFPGEVNVSSTYLKIAFCFIQGARFEDALKQLEKAGRNGPSVEEKPEILYWTAVCFEKLGDQRKAIAEFLKVPASYEKIGEWAITSEFEAARLYERVGEPKKALGLYKKIALSGAGEISKEATANVSRLSILTKEN